MGFLRRLFGKKKRIEETVDTVPEYSIPEHSIPKHLLKYLPRFTEPFWRKESALFYGLPENDLQAMMEYASKEFNVPIIGFEGIIGAENQENLAQYLKQYKDSGIIVPDVFHSNENYTPEQTEHVFARMRSEEAMQGIPFYMFTAQNTQEIKENWRYNYHHPMYNWNMFIDLSEP